MSSNSIWALVELFQGTPIPHDASAFFPLSYDDAASFVLSSAGHPIWHQPLLFNGLNIVPQLPNSHPQPPLGNIITPTNFDTASLLQTSQELTSATSSVSIGSSFLQIQQKAFIYYQ